MAIVKVSPEFEFTIKIVAGQELNIHVRDGSIHLNTPRSLESLRAIGKGMSWKDDYRDHTDRF